VLLWNSDFQVGTLPRLAPKPLYLNEEERKQLLQLLNRHSTPQQIAIRANIVWLADAGRNHRQITRDLNVSLNMAKLWRKRWLEGQEKGIPVLERLQDEERSGAPAKFTMEQVLQLFKMACEDPADYNRPISQWTSRELAEEMVKQKLVESISERQVGRFMAEATLKPQQSGYWLNPPPTNISTKRSKTFVESI
jgi:putative transposase